MADAAYEIDVVALDGQADFRLVGEFDLANSEELEARLFDALEAAVPVVVDMGQVTFADSTTLRALVAAHNLAEARGTTIRLVNVAGAARQVLEITGLYEILVDPGPDS
jgi:stage II sporulation protein AA (anti-sigma F factor antagonist)